MKGLSIVFMGTPEFAVTILDGILKHGIEVKAVVTAPDKPAGRGLKLNESAVKRYAVDHKLEVLQPEKLKDDTFLQQLESYHADLFVVVAFRMLPEAVWNMPPKGTINLHASLLPQYRGAAPINWAIINGEKSTGVTTFFLDHEIDTGKVIEQRSVSIGENETIGELYERLMHLGTETVLSTLDKIQSGDYQAIDQGSFDISALKHAPKIFREDCEIDLQLTAAEVHNKIRGLSPYPAAWIKLRSLKDDTYKTFKIFRSLKTDTPVIEGHHLERSSNGILFPCSDYYVEVLELQPEGKRKMSAKEFLAGNDISDWSL